MPSPWHALPSSSPDGIRATPTTGRRADPTRAFRPPGILRADMAEVHSSSMTHLKRPETLTAAVATHIRDSIVRGDYPPGSPLPEIRLAQELGTSRGTVREALRALDELGLVDIEPHRGSFVSKVTKRKARELYELRGVLEGAAIHLAVEHGLLDGSARDALAGRMEAMREAAKGDDPMGLIEAERALHREIWSRCDNELLLEYLGNV
jgi:DNA-binding GntR family transcriptional regulator